MKVTILAWLAWLTLASIGGSAQAGLLEDACDLAYGKLASVPNLGLKKTTGNFTDNGHTYTGCVVHLEGDHTKIKDVHYPGPLFYPYEDTTLYQQGWRADREADGPDGTSFLISRQNVFCLVEGIWDGGDGYEVIVSCSYQRRYTFDEFLRLSAFRADVDRIIDLPGPPTFATALSGPDRRIVLRTKAGETIVIDNVPTSLSGNFCGTINAWLPIKECANYLFPDVLRPRPDCTQIYVK